MSQLQFTKPWSHWSSMTGLHCCPPALKVIFKPTSHAKLRHLYSKGLGSWTQSKHRGGAEISREEHQLKMGIKQAAITTAELKGRSAIRSW